VNALATKYGWQLSRVVNGCELIVSDVRLFLLAIAYRIPTRMRYETEPTTLDVFEEMTGISDRRLRDIRKLLVALGEVERGDTKAGAWPKHARYRMLGVAGPLFVVGRFDVDENAAAGAAFRSVNAAAGADFDTQTRRLVPTSPGQTRRPVPRFGADAGGVSISPEVRTSDHHHHPSIAGSLADAHEFLDRWATEFGRHNNGASYSIDVEAELPLVLELLRGRSPAKLWSMALALWACTDEQDKWIAGTNRSIRVLRQAANTLDQLVSRPVRVSAGSPGQCRYRHQPPCANNILCAERERKEIAERDAREGALSDSSLISSRSASACG
jgi:hypothetical protein